MKRVLILLSFGFCYLGLLLMVEYSFFSELIFFNIIHLIFPPYLLYVLFDSFKSQDIIRIDSVFRNLQHSKIRLFSKKETIFSFEEIDHIDLLRETKISSGQYGSRKYYGYSARLILTNNE